MNATFRGVAPLTADTIRIMLLVFVPPIRLFLVRIFNQGPRSRRPCAHQAVPPAGTERLALRA